MNLDPDGPAASGDGPQPFYYSVAEYKNADKKTRHKAGIFKRAAFGPDKTIIVKDDFRSPEEAEEWAEYHANMRDYRPFERDNG